MEITRNKHFKAWLEKVYIGCATRHKGIDESAARTQFNDEYMEDVNMISFIMTSIFPNTFLADDGSYHFVTKDDFVHKDIESGEEYHPGRMTLWIDNRFNPKISFDDKRFQHGQVADDGHIICWGGMTPFPNAFCEIGLSGALMEMYNFARVSNHDTRMKEIA